MPNSETHRQGNIKESRLYLHKKQILFIFETII